MSDLDFSGLTDDQLIELAAGLAQEALRRNPATAAAFEAALIEEHERVQAQLRGSEEAKKAALQKIEAEAAAEARRVAEEVADEKARKKKRDALLKYAEAAAKILGRDLDSIIFIYEYAGRDEQYLRINDINAGRYSTWHLVNYEIFKDSLWVTPVARKKSAELNAWARECIAAIRALKISPDAIVKGNEICLTRMRS